MDSEKEIKFIKDFAEEVKSWNKQQSIEFLQSAGILDKNGEISENYPELKKYNEK